MAEHQEAHGIEAELPPGREVLDGDVGFGAGALSKAGTAADNLRGQIRWAKPGPKSGPNADNQAIAGAPL